MKIIALYLRPRIPRSLVIEDYHSRMPKRISRSRGESIVIRANFSNNAPSYAIRLTARESRRHAGKEIRLRNIFSGRSVTSIDFPADELVKVSRSSDRFRRQRRRRRRHADRYMQIEPVPAGASDYFWITMSGQDPGYRVESIPGSHAALRWEGEGATTRRSSGTRANSPRLRPMPRGD